MCRGSSRLSHFDIEKRRHLSVSSSFLWWERVTRYCRYSASPSSERHRLSYAAPTLSLKTPCYGVFICAVRTAYGLTRSLSNPPSPTSQKKTTPFGIVFIHMVGEGGFEPPKSLTTDLQSAPFGHSGTLPHYGAGGRTRTPDLLITNQLLYQLSYTSTFSCSVIISYRATFVNSFFIEIIKKSSYINVFRSNRRAYQVICNAYSHNKRRSAFNIRDRFGLCYISG